MSHVPESDNSRFKTRVRNACEKYSRIKAPYRYKQIIDNLSKNKSIVILKQDKGRGVVIMDRDMHTQKCLDLLDNDQFKCLDTDPTNKTEGEVQRLLRSIKSKIPEKVYKKVYPTGSRPGRFYGTAKLHKITNQQSVNDLPIRPIVTNIGTATYHLS